MAENQDRIVGLDEAAKLLGRSRRTVYRWLATGLLEAHHPSGRQRVQVTRESIERYLAARTAAPRVSLMELAARVLVLEHQVNALSATRRWRGARRQPKHSAAETEAEAALVPRGAAGSRAIYDELKGGR